MKAIVLAGVVLAAFTLPACKPPPTDAAVARAAIMPAAGGPSTPLTSPVTEDAIWAASGGPSAKLLRLVYGVPGEPVLLALECLDAAAPTARLKITRHASADSGAGALLALIGNGRIGRFPVDSTPLGGRLLWQGEVPAVAPGWDAFKGEREATATVPGAGLVRLNPSPLPMQLVETCRGNGSPDQPADPA
jgi:hypothetical protein